MGNSNTVTEHTTVSNAMADNTSVGDSMTEHTTMGNAMTEDATVSDAMADNTTVSDVMADNTTVSDAMADTDNSSGESSSAIGSDFGNISINVVGVVVDVLDPSVRQVDGVVSLPGSGAIVSLLGVETGSRVVVSHGILVGVWEDLIWEDWHSVGHSMTHYSMLVVSATAVPVANLGLVGGGRPCWPRWRTWSYLRTRCLQCTTSTAVELVSLEDMDSLKDMASIEDMA